MTVYMKALQDNEFLREIQPTIARVAFEMGMAFTRLDIEFRALLLEHIDGSETLMHEAVKVAAALEREWRAMNQGQKDNFDYLGACADRAIIRLQELCGEVAAERLKSA